MWYRRKSAEIQQYIKPTHHTGLAQIAFKHNACWLVHAAQGAAQFISSGHHTAKNLSIPNWNMKFSELLLAVAKLGCWCTQIDGVGETASQGSCDSKSQALCVKSLCTSASVSTCNGSRQNFPLAAKLSQQFLGEPFLTANALDTHRYAKCSGYPVHKTVKKQNIHVEIQTSYMELFTCSQLDTVFINSLVLWINKNWKWLIVLPVIPCKWWLDWRL